MTSSSNELVDVAHSGAITTLTLNRPEKKNALSIALRDRVSDALDELKGRDETRAVVITGRGSAFSAGFDLAEFEQMNSERFSKRLWASSDRFHRSVLTFPLPLVAAVNGPAIGGGFDLAVMCDLRIASEEAYFEHPERRFIEVVYAPLHDLVGGALARDLCLTGRRLVAREAERVGLVSRVTSPDTLADEALRLAIDVAETPRDILVQMKAKFIRRAAIMADNTAEL